MQFQIVRNSTEQININYKKENVCVRVCVCQRDTFKLKAT